MSSPQSTTSHEDQSKKNLEQITFRFCAECANMLYPKEDEDSHKLQFTCRTCQYTEEAGSTCVFRNILNNAAGETAGVTQDVGSDPTVGSLSPVPHCTSAPLCAAGMPVLCLCCGGLVVCAVCGDYAMPRASAATATTSTSDDDDDDDDNNNENDSPAKPSPVYGLYDFDTDGCPLSQPDDEYYDFMDGMEYGNTA